LVIQTSPRDQARGTITPNAGNIRRLGKSGAASTPSRSNNPHYFAAIIRLGGYYTPSRSPVIEEHLVLSRELADGDRARHVASAALNCNVQREAAAERKNGNQ
jgi:hypothetical protein